MRFGLRRVGWMALLSAAGWAQGAGSGQPELARDARYRVGDLLYADDFRHGLDKWRVEMERPGSVTAEGGVLDIDVPAGVTVWFKQEIEGPVMILVRGDGGRGRWGK